MRSDGTGSFRLRNVRDGTSAFIDASCGACESYMGGNRLWCTQPGLQSRQMLTGFPTEFEEALERSVLEVAALREVKSDGVIAMVGPHAATLAAPATAIAPVEVVIAPNAGDAGFRSEMLELHPSGRARVIVTTGDVRAAVKAARRICLHVGRS